MNFVHDSLADGQPFRVLTVVDQWSRQSSLLMVAPSMSGQRVAEALDLALLAGPALRSITVDHGSEFQSRALEDWAHRRGVQLDFTQPEEPTENVFIESLNGRLRDECLNVHQFTSIEDARARIEAWRIDYDHHRRHGSLGQRTPAEFVRQHHTKAPKQGAISSRELSANVANVSRSRFPAENCRK